jgi:hypothetical protein
MFSVNQILRQILKTGWFSGSFLKKDLCPFSVPKKILLLPKSVIFPQKNQYPFMRHHILDAAGALVVEAEKYIAQLTKEANKLAEHAGRKTIMKTVTWLQSPEINSFL